MFRSGGGKGSGGSRAEGAATELQQSCNTSRAEGNGRAKDFLLCSTSVAALLQLCALQCRRYCSSVARAGSQCTCFTSVAALFQRFRMRASCFLLLLFECAHVLILFFLFLF